MSGRLRRKASIGAVLLACVLTLTGCFPWAHKDCKPHGGLASVRKLGSSNVWVAKCNDGKEFYK